MFGLENPKIYGHDLVETKVKGKVIDTRFYVWTQYFFDDPKAAEIFRDKMTELQLTPETQEAYEDYFSYSRMEPYQGISLSTGICQCNFDPTKGRVYAMLAFDAKAISPDLKEPSIREKIAKDLQNDPNIKQAVEDAIQQAARQKAIAKAKGTDRESILARAHRKLDAIIAGGGWER